MKKIIITLAIACASLLSINANAQETALVQGNNIISATIGFGSFTVNNIGVPPVAVSYERIVCEFGGNWSVGVGAFGGFFTQKYEDSTHNFGGSICAQGNVHFCPTEKWDIYAGLGLGYVGYKIKDSLFTVSTSAFACTPMVGARYFFSEKFGVNFQFGGLGIGNVGVTFRF